MHRARGLLGMLAVAGVAWAAQGVALGQDSARPYEGMTLRVASYGGGTGKAIREGVTAEFEKQTGATITWTEGAGLEYLAQLAAAKGGPPPYDVVFLEDLMEPQAVKQELIVKPDFANIPNAALLPPEMIMPSGYGPGWSYFRLVIAYRPDKLSEAGIEPPKDLSIIFEERLQGHLALPDINQSNWPHFMPSFAQFFGNSLDNPDPTIEKIASVKGAVLYSSSSDLEARMSSGEIWVALWIDGRANGLKAKGVNVEIAPLGIPNPAGGTFDYTAGLFVTQISNPDPKVKALAEVLINIVLSAPFQTNFSKTTTYTPGNLEAQKAVLEDPKIGAFFDSDLSKAFRPDFEAWDVNRLNWVNAWGRAMR